jgi:hypothetical protein
MSIELWFKQTSMVMVVEDGHRKTFNLNPSGDKNTKSRQGFWKVASNCPMYHTDTYNISKYNVCASLNGDVPTITTILRAREVQPIVVIQLHMYSYNKL